MAEPVMTNLLLSALAMVGISLLCHWLIRRAVIALGVSVVVSVVCFLLPGSLAEYRVDPFFLPGVLILGIEALIVSVVTGIPFFVVRRIRSNRGGRPDE